MNPPEPKVRPARLALLAVRDVVLFPHMALPLSVGRDKSIRALESAVKEHKFLCVVAQKQAQVEDPQGKDMYWVGVLAEVVQFLKMPDGTLKVFLQGVCRARAVNPAFSTPKGYWETDIEYPSEAWENTPEMQALVRQALAAFETFIRLSGRVSNEVTQALGQMQDVSRLADTIAANVLGKISDRQALLETFNVGERLERLIGVLQSETEILELERKIQTRVRGQIEKTQKEYYLTEQMKAIQKELRQKDDFAKEIDELRKKVEAAKMPKEALEASLKEVARLEKMMPFSPESTVCRTYLDWMIGLPWAVRTADSLDLDRAAKILEEDHYGLEKAKDRVLEYLAVCKLTKKLKGPILCFVGPPGVGKTSMGRSVARAIGRQFVRMSLGGVRDEAEIRGHRRTYIGSLPGRIIQSMRKAKSKNPVFLLDEIDKMGMDWRGDPAAALLEVLDPEQNSTFTDHYLDVEFDLSEVLFITTANTLESIPVSLQDRLETLRFPGYTHREKVAIAQKYLVPKQLSEHGLPKDRLEVAEGALDRMIHDYTREAGVRNLEREIANLCRKAARKFAQDSPKRPLRVTSEEVPKFLGIPKYVRDQGLHNDVGVATGLAWTEHGGETLPIEVVALPGKGSFTLTGRLGSVMQESAWAALSYIRSIASRWGVAKSFFKGTDFHIHVPEGAVPKDGPSAGIALAVALASRLSGLKVASGVAMTGEVTLRGRVLPIGGLKEKVVAAHREGVQTVLYPEGNKKDLEEIPQDIQSALRLVPVKTMEEVLDLALEKPKGRPASKSSRPQRPPKPQPRTGYVRPEDIPVPPPS